MSETEVIREMIIKPKGIDDPYSTVIKYHHSTNVGGYSESNSNSTTLTDSSNGMDMNINMSMSELGSSSRSKSGNIKSSKKRSTAVVVLNEYPKNTVTANFNKVSHIERDSNISNKRKGGKSLSSESQSPSPPSVKSATVSPTSASPLTGSPTTPTSTTPPTTTTVTTATVSDDDEECGTREIDLEHKQEQGQQQDKKEQEHLIHHHLVHHHHLHDIEEDHALQEYEIETEPQNYSDDDEDCDDLYYQYNQHADDPYVYSDDSESLSDAYFHPRHDNSLMHPASGRNFFHFFAPQYHHFGDEDPMQPGGSHHSNQVLQQQNLQNHQYHHPYANHSYGSADSAGILTGPRTASQSSLAYSERSASPFKISGSIQEDGPLDVDDEEWHFSFNHDQYVENNPASMNDLLCFSPPRKKHSSKQFQEQHQQRQHNAMLQMHATHANQIAGSSTNPLIGIASNIHSTNVTANYGAVNTASVSRKERRRQRRQQKAIARHRKLWLACRQREMAIQRERAVSEVRGQPQDTRRCQDPVWAAIFVIQLLIVVVCAIRYGSTFGVKGILSKSPQQRKMHYNYRFLLQVEALAQYENDFQQKIQSNHETIPNTDWTFLRPNSVKHRRKLDQPKQSPTKPPSSLVMYTDTIKHSTVHDDDQHQNGDSTQEPTSKYQYSQVSTINKTMITRPTTTSTKTSQSSAVSAKVSQPSPTSSYHQNDLQSNTTQNKVSVEKSSTIAESMNESTIDTKIKSDAKEIISTLSSLSSSFIIDYQNVVSLIIVAGFYACVMSYLSFGFMLIISRAVIQVILILSVLLALAWGTIGITMDPYGIISIMGFTALFLSLGYTMYNWSHIPFAAINLHTSLCAMRCTADITILGIGTILLAFAWCLVWSVAFIGIVDGLGTVDSPSNGHEDATSTLYYQDSLLMKNLNQTNHTGAAVTGVDTGTNASLGNGFVYLYFYYQYTVRTVIYVFLLISFYWTNNVIKNTIRVTVASAIGTWWFYPNDIQSLCCTTAVSKPLIRSLTKSLGTISFGSFILFPAQILLAMNQWCCGHSFLQKEREFVRTTNHSIGSVSNASSKFSLSSSGGSNSSSNENLIQLHDSCVNANSTSNHNTGNAGTSTAAYQQHFASTKRKKFKQQSINSQKQKQKQQQQQTQNSESELHTYERPVGDVNVKKVINPSKTNSIIDRWNRFLRCCNGWSFTYIGMYGYTFCEGGEKAIHLFETREWMEVVNDNLIQNVLWMTSIVIGGSCGCFAVIAEEVDGYEFTTLNKPIMTSFIIGSVIGFVLSSILLLGVVGSALNTVLVCFAAGPFEFDKNHPRLSREMREVWSQQVWEPLV